MLRLELAAPPAACLAGFGIAYFYNDSIPLWAKLNSLSSDRLRLFHLAVTSLSPSAFGAQVTNEELYTLDNLYLGGFYTLGYVGFALYLGLLLATLYRCWKQGWLAETVVLLSLLVYGCLEAACWENTCPALLLFANAIYLVKPEKAVHFSPSAPPAEETSALPASP